MQSKSTFVEFLGMYSLQICPPPSPWEIIQGLSKIRQLFIMFKITTSKHHGFYMLTVSSIISFAVILLHLA